VNVVRSLGVLGRLSDTNVVSAASNDPLSAMSTVSATTLTASLSGSTSLGVTLNNNNNIINNNTIFM